MNINSLNTAYDILKKGILDFLKSRPWDKAYNQSQIIDNSSTIRHRRVINNEAIMENQYAYHVNSLEVLDALLYIRV